MASFISNRRFFLSKRITAALEDNHALSALWQYKQEQEAGGAVLPATFPKKAELAAVGYVAEEDLVGADAEELIDFVKLSRRDADAVIAAFAAL